MRALFVWLLPLLFLPLYFLALVLAGVGHGTVCLYVVVTFPWCLPAYWIAMKAPGSPGVIMVALLLICVVQYALIGRFLDKRLFAQKP